ncbi:hypothetical protein B0T22DRAFT_30089 [Podospora appendiculata]|uniref:Uncharacterized protein n=1 Tax=Podospora appendiculata TaxID=314037 RepID=A0AAE1CFZ5_9PEZI|nr:hypothetical protein B0T22DRAFT_30089 [Podospora appendiculata]
MTLTVWALHGYEQLFAIFITVACMQSTYEANLDGFCVWLGFFTCSPCIVWLYVKCSGASRRYTHNTPPPESGFGYYIYCVLSNCLFFFPFCVVKATETGSCFGLAYTPFSFFLSPLFFSFLFVAFGNKKNKSQSGRLAGRQAGGLCI